LATIYIGSLHSEEVGETGRSLLRICNDSYLRIPILMAKGRYLLYSSCMNSQNSFGPR